MSTVSYRTQQDWLQDVCKADGTGVFPDKGSTTTGGNKGSLLSYFPPPPLSPLLSPLTSSSHLPPTPLSSPSLPPPPGPHLPSTSSFISSSSSLPHPPFPHRLLLIFLLYLLITSFSTSSSLSSSISSFTTSSISSSPLPSLPISLHRPPPPSPHTTMQQQYNNITLLPSVNTLIARGMFCGTKYTHHTFTPIIKHLITTTAK